MVHDDNSTAYIIQSQFIQIHQTINPKQVWWPLPVNSQQFLSSFRFNDNFLSINAK